MRTESIVVSLGRPHQPGAPVNTPIVASATYRNDGTDNRYARSYPNDTVRDLEVALGALDRGTALAFSSGMGAVAAVVEAQPVGTVAVIPDAAYSGTMQIFAEQERLGRMTVRRVDIADTAAVRAALDGAGLLWTETVTNPLLAVADLPVLVEAARRAGVFVGVDATFSTPLNIRPLELGADVVMHSVTKYLSGHSDVLLGALVTGSEELAERLQFRRTIAGTVPGALEAFLALRGVRTFVLRFERAQDNAMELARRLAAHPRVSRVRYPGLPEDPGHAVAGRVFRGYGAMISFEVAGDATAADGVAAALRLITNATSLGGVESLLERRAQHAVDESFGTPPTLLRLSVGIEHVEDLWDDLAQALG
jgi:cystathionine gamma-synthase